MRTFQTIAAELEFQRQRAVRREAHLRAERQAPEAAEASARRAWQLSSWGGRRVDGGERAQH
jgi:hypothetical protein